MPLHIPQQKPQIRVWGTDKWRVTRAGTYIGYIIKAKITSKTVRTGGRTLIVGQWAYTSFDTRGKQLATQQFSLQQALSIFSRLKLGE